MGDDAMEGKAAAAAGGGSPPLMEGIAHPGLNDVMFGRGGDTNYHIGNHRFRVLADEHRQEYRSASRKEKALVVQEVVRIWRGRGGRFLTKTEPEKGDESLWHDVGDTVAKKKAAKILSEKAPEERNQKDDDGRKGRKRPAVDSVDADRAAKQATLLPAGKKPTLTAMAATGPGVAALLTNAGSFQQPPPPVQQPSSAPSLQLPIRFPLTPLVQQAQSQAGIQQALQLPLAGGVSSTQTLRDILGTQRSDHALTTPLLLAALGAGGGVNAMDLGSSPLVVAARALLQRHEQDAARSRALLTHALLLNNLRIGNENQATSRPAATSTLDANTLVAAARLGLTPDQMRLLVLTNAAAEGLGTTNNNGNSNNESKSLN